MYEKSYKGFLDVLFDIRDGKFVLVSEHIENRPDDADFYDWIIYALPGCDELYLSGTGGLKTAFGGKARVHEVLCDGETVKGRWRLASIGLMFGPYAVSAVKEYYGL